MPKSQDDIGDALPGIADILQQSRPPRLPDQTRLLGVFNQAPRLIAYVLDRDSIVVATNYAVAP